MVEFRKLRDIPDSRLRWRIGFRNHGMPPPCNNDGKQTCEKQPPSVFLVHATLLSKIIELARLHRSIFQSYELSNFCLTPQPDPASTGKQFQLTAERAVQLFRRTVIFSM